MATLANRMRGFFPSKWMLTLSLIGLLAASFAYAHLPEQEFEQARQWALERPEQVIVWARPILDDQTLPIQQQAEIRLLLINAYLSQGELEPLDSLIAGLEQIARRSGNQRYATEALRARANKLFIQTQYEAALEVNLRAQAQLIPGQNEDLAGILLREQAQCLRALKRYPEALESVQKAIGLLRKTGATQALADAFNTLGVTFELMGNYEESLSAHLQALDYRRALNDRPGQADSLYNIGEIYRELGDFENAASYIQRSVAIDQVLNNRSNLAYGLQKLADVQCALGEYEQATTNADRSLQLFRALDAPENVAAVLRKRADIELKQQHYSNALAFLQQLDALADVAPLAQADPNNILLRIRALIGLGNLDQTLYWLKYLELRKAELSDEVRLEFYQLGSQVHQTRGDAAQSLGYLQAYHALADELARRKQQQSVEHLRASMSFLKREQQYEVLAKDNALDDLRAATERFKRYVFWAAVAGLLAMLAILYGRVQLRRFNQQLQQQVQARTEELEQKNTELRRAYEQLQTVSQTDPLTGLANRRFLAQHIENDCARVSRDYLNWLQNSAPLPMQSDLVFYLLDLDLFKQVNDRFGHPVGDSVLAQMKGVLQQVFRETDYLVRWGGEEFLVVARYSQRENAALIAERLRSTVEEFQFQVNETQSVHLSTSIGFACFPFFADRPGEYQWTQVVDIADRCLYAAKHSGRNCWVGLTGAEGLETTDNFRRLMAEPEQVIAEGWVNFYTSLSDPAKVGWAAHDHANY